MTPDDLADLPGALSFFKGSQLIWFPLGETCGPLYEKEQFSLWPPGLIKAERFRFSLAEVDLL